MPTMAAIAVVVAVAVGGAASAWAQTRGKIYFSDEPFPKADSQAALVKLLKKGEKKEIGKTGEEWKLHLLAFLSGPAGAKELKLVFYEAGKKGDPVNSFDLTSVAKQTTMLSQISLESSGGFKAGVKYRVVLLRLSGNKETVLARGEIGLK